MTVYQTIMLIHRENECLHQTKFTFGITYFYHTVLPFHIAKIDLGQDLLMVSFVMFLIACKLSELCSSNN